MQLPSYKLLSIVSVVILVASFVVMGQKEANFIHNPQVYDPSTGHVIPLDIRGTGTVYLTPTEAQSLKPYAYGVYAAVALVVLVVGARIVIQAYCGFMSGWRS